MLPAHMDKPNARVCSRQLQRQLWQRAALPRAALPRVAVQTPRRGGRAGSLLGVLPRAPTSCRTVSCWDKATVPHLPPGTGSPPVWEPARCHRRRRAAVSCRSPSTHDALAFWQLPRPCLHRLILQAAVTREAIPTSTPLGQRLTKLLAVPCGIANTWGPSTPINGGEWGVMGILDKLLECSVGFAFLF